MSRWFKYVFIVMVLFVIRMAIRVNTSGPSEPEESMYVSTFYEEFQNDYEAAMDKYGGEHVTVEGEIAEIVEIEDGFVIYLSDGSYEPMIEVYPTKLRNYPRNRFDEGQYVAVTGKVLDEQDAEWVTMKHCQIF